MALELVIFDCDGVLIDSEVIACRIEAEMLSAHGLPYDEDEIARRYSGIPPAAMYDMMERESGLAIPEALRQAIRERIRAALVTELTAVPGVHEAVAGLDRPVCVASSSSLDYLERALGLVDLYRHFRPHVFSSQQVANGKPAPDLFLFAAARMGAAPADCLVIEDSIAGVQAGRAAGMQVLGFAGGGHCRPGHEARLREAGAGRVFAEMRALPELLAGLL